MSSVVISYCAFDPRGRAAQWERRNSFHALAQVREHLIEVNSRLASDRADAPWKVNAISKPSRAKTAASTAPVPAAPPSVTRARGRAPTRRPNSIVTSIPQNSPKANPLD